MRQAPSEESGKVENTGFQKWVIAGNWRQKLCSECTYPSISLSIIYLVSRSLREIILPWTGTRVWRILPRLNELLAMTVFLYLFNFASFWPLNNRPQSESLPNEMLSFIFVAPSIQRPLKLRLPSFPPPLKTRYLQVQIKVLRDIFSPLYTSRPRNFAMVACQSIASGNISVFPPMGWPKIIPSTWHVLQVEISSDSERLIDANCSKKKARCQSPAIRNEASPTRTTFNVRWRYCTSCKSEFYAFQVRLEFSRYKLCPLKVYVELLKASSALEIASNQRFHVMILSRVEWATFYRMVSYRTNYASK